MAYREKVAWLSLLAMALTFGPYFTAVVLGIFDQESLPNLPLLRWLNLTLVAQMLILGTGQILMRLRWPADARAPLDERDRAILQRSVTSAYYVLIIAAILPGCVMPFISGGWKIVNTMLFAIVLAEVVHYGFVVVGYRRQA